MPCLVRSSAAPVLASRLFCGNEEQNGVFKEPSEDGAVADRGFHSYCFGSKPGESDVAEKWFRK